jgi:hypothetical protein
MKKLLLLILFTCVSYSAFSVAIVSQKDWRWRKDDGDEATATWSAEEDEAVAKSICENETVRLRMSFLIDPGTGAPNGWPGYSASFDYRISYSTDPNGTFTRISQPSLSEGTEHFMLWGSNFVSNESTNGQLSTAAVEELAYVQGQEVDSNRTSNVVFNTPIESSSVTEYEWIFQPTEFAEATTYYFKLEGLNGYADLPSLIYNPLTTVSLNGSTLTADNGSATYQWVDCDNEYQPIDGETNQTFTPLISGNYAVIATQDGCEKLSVCTAVDVTVTGIHDNASTSTMLVHPNPSNGNFVLETDKTVTIEIYSPAGQVVFNKTVEKGSHSINLDTAGTGVYFMTTTDANGNRTSQKIVLSK